MVALSFWAAGCNVPSENAAALPAAHHQGFRSPRSPGDAPRCARGWLQLHPCTAPGTSRPPPCQAMPRQSPQRQRRRKIAIQHLKNLIQLVERVPMRISLPNGQPLDCLHFALFGTENVMVGSGFAWLRV